MAHITGQGRGYVGGPFTRGEAAVMAVLTHIRGLAVVKGCANRDPLAGVMAGLAVVRGQRMRGRFGGTGTGAVMTTGRVTRRCGLSVVKRTD